MQLDKASKTTIFGGFGIYYDRSLFDVAVDETQKLTHPTLYDPVRAARRRAGSGAGRVE